MRRAPDPAAVRRFQRRLLAWYRAHGRKLPWRRTRDPYRILVSEIMLQQTQVDRVKGFYRRFVRQYPSFEHLAAADEPQVREAWDGLGYYARARNLQRTAQRVVDEHAGRLPDDPQVIRQLPGIGRYTAGAVLSIAYGRDEPILDTNAARVLTRWFGFRPRGGPGIRQRRLWELAAHVTPRGVAGDFNQAIMDLGATICTARVARCESCPVRAGCAEEKKNGTTDEHR
ncbi:MAG: A/G-specific adenine glycosylase [Deltaproteobacteria bacterium]|nr:A/G-specific adenine glycosylase [Deltaproteobacteria bacterium]